MDRENLVNDQIQGLIAAVFTPMDDRGEILPERIPAYAQFLAEQGLAGVFVNGTTGEGVSLTMNERLRLAEIWIDAAPPSLRVIVHVGHTCLKDAQRLAEHAQAQGAGGISAIAPYFFRPQTAGDLVDWCAALAAAAPELPFYYYHMPAMSGVHLPAIEVLKLAGEAIPNLAGMKFTFEDISEYRACRDFQSRRYDVVFGRDQILLSALEAGARGAIGSTFNFAAPLYRSIIEIHQQGDGRRAALLQQRARTMIEICQAAGGSELAALKSVMELVGQPCGPVRLPLRDLTVEQRERLHAALRESRVLEPAPALKNVS